MKLKLVKSFVFSSLGSDISFSFFYCACVSKLTGVTLHGRTGQIFPFHAEEENGAASENVPILCHNMAERTVRALHHQLRQKIAILICVQVFVLVRGPYFFPNLVTMKFG